MSSMKLIVALIQPFMLDKLARALLKAPISGYSVTECRGSTGEDSDGPDYQVPRLRVEIVVTEEKKDETVAVILNTVSTHQKGDGLIYIVPLEDVINIRTGKHGQDAVFASHK